MPYLFAYGSLQQESVQLYAFGRLLEGEPDELPEHERSLVPIGDPHVVAETGQTHYTNVTFNGRPESRVTGTAFVIAHSELDAADRYEDAASYRRREVTLASGRRAWVYSHVVNEAAEPSAPVEAIESIEEVWPIAHRVAEPIASTEPVESIEPVELIEPAGPRLPLVVVRDRPGLWWLLGLMFIGAGGALVYLGIVSASALPPWQAAAVTVMGVVAVATGVAWTWRSPLSRVVVDPQARQVTLSQFGLFGRRSRRFAFDDIREVVVQRRRDDDGAMMVRPALVMKDRRQEPLSALWRHDPAGITKAIATLRSAIRR